MEWNVKNAVNRDVERQQLNKILADIRATIGSSGGLGEQDVRRIVQGALSTVPSVAPSTTVILEGDVTGRGTGRGTITVQATVNGSVTDAPIDATPYWRNSGNWESVPDALLALANMEVGGLLVYDLDNLVYTTAEITGVAGQIEVLNGNGSQGNPEIGLAEVTDSGGGQLRKFDKDDYGRVTGTSAATTDDLDEGTSNLYYTDARADARVVATAFGYDAPVAFASGLSVNTTRLTVTQGGVTYAPVADAIPFTTTGTFDPAQWRVVRGVTTADLGAASGATLVGYAPGVTVKAQLDAVGSRVSEAESDINALNDELSILGRDFEASGVLSAGVASRINFDFVGNSLTIAPLSTNLISGRRSIAIPGQTVTIPPDQYRAIFVDITTGAVSFGAGAVPAGKAYAGAILRAASGTSGGFVYGVPVYSVNGISMDQVSYTNGLLTSAPAGLNFNRSSGTLVVAADTVRASWDRRTFLLPAQSVVLPVGGTPHRIMLDITTGALTFGTYATALPVGKVDVGGYLPSTGAIWGIGSYQVDGVSNTTRVQNNAMLVGNSEDVNFDIAAGLLRVASDKARVIHGNVSALITGQDVALPAASGNAWFILLFDTVTGALSFLRATNQIPVTSVYVGAYHPPSQVVAGIACYRINGAEVVGGRPSVRDASWIAADDPPLFESPAQSGFGWIAAAQHADVYGLYDALAANHPEYITKSLLGNDESGRPVYCYDFNPPQPGTPLPQSDSPAKMILISGIHGPERTGVYGLYLAMKELCDNGDAVTDHLRRDCRFIVVPVVNPYGFDANTRKNANEVDVARNFPAGWTLGPDPSASTYGGASPLSELSAQYLDALMNTHRDAIYFGSFHNFFNTAGNTFIWNTSATNFGVSISKALLRKIVPSWRSRFAWIPPSSGVFMGYCDRDAPGGSEGYQATVAYGIQGGTFEIGEKIDTAPNPNPYSPEVAQLGCEVIVNWLAYNLRHAPVFYNARL